MEELAGGNEQFIVEVLKKPADELVNTAKILLNHVIATNFTGFLGFHESNWISEEQARLELSRDLNQPCFAVRSSWAMTLLKRILIDALEKHFENLDSLPLEEIRLKLRFFTIWQQFLIDRDSWILENGETLIEIIEKSIGNLENKEEKAKIFLEMAYFHFIFYQFDKANNFILKASEECQLNVDLTGMMGKRTRYQNKDIAQLVLAYKNTANIGPEVPPSKDIPIDCSLNDDTLLEQVKVTQKTDENHVQVEGNRLTDTQLACLIWLAKHEKGIHCADMLVHERCMPFLNTVLSARRNWAIQSAALLLRADLEKSHGRRVDRSCSQTELVCKLMQGIEDETPEDVKLQRVDFVLISGLEPSWQASVLHTGILRSLGCTSEALLILEKLQLWENVIDCYKSLGQMEKAESLIRRLLETKPSDSMLYVFLGDITQSLDYYYKAIEISNDRNARAHKSLGLCLLMRSKYEEAYKHLRRSLELQPIQLGTWFNAGYCAWKLENYKDATQCYHRCVSFQPDHFEAWNNLSAAYIRLGQKDKAWKLLQEALKFNYEHANVWENYMLLSVDVGSFSQAITAYHRLLDLNKRGADDEVLELLATHIMKREKELEDSIEREENAKDRVELVKLLARISANHQTLSPKTLKVYAELKKPTELNDETRTEYEKYIQLLEKSFGVANGKQNWSKDEALSQDVIETAILLAHDRLELAKFVNTATSVKEASSRIRLSLRSVITRIEKDANDRGNFENNSKLNSFVEEAKSILATVSL